jgi:hypothetical protein
METMPHRPSDSKQNAVKGSLAATAQRGLSLDSRAFVSAARLPHVLCHPVDSAVRATYGLSERGYWVEVTREGLAVACGTFPTGTGPGGRKEARALRALLLFMWTLGFFRGRQRRSGKGRTGMNAIARNLREAAGT